MKVGLLYNDIERMTPAELLSVVETRYKQADDDRVILAHYVANFVGHAFEGTLKDLRQYLPDLRTPQGYHKRALKTAEHIGMEI